MCRSIGTYVIGRNINNENLHPKAVTMIYLVPVRFEIAKYDDKRAISIANLFETPWLSRYPRPIEITYDQGSEFIGREFRKSLIEDKYEITANLSTSGNSMSNAVLERIYQVLGNLVQTFNIYQTYVNENDPWTGILAAAEFGILSTTNRKKVYSPGQLRFGRDMVLTIKHRLDWESICQKNQTQINKDIIRKNSHRNLEIMP